MGADGGRGFAALRAAVPTWRSAVPYQLAVPCRLHGPQNTQESLVKTVR